MKDPFEGMILLKFTAHFLYIVHNNSGSQMFYIFLSFKVNNKILLSRRENEVEELKRRVEEAKIKLGSEMKVRAEVGL